MDEITIKVMIRTSNAGSTCTDAITIPREEWEKATEKEREEMCQDAAFQMMEWNYTVDESVEHKEE